MKKIYLLASFLGAATFAFNQVGQVQVPFQKTMMKINKNVPSAKHFANAPTMKAGGDSIWGSDFSEATSPWTIGHETSTTGNWVIGTFTDLPAIVQQGNYYVGMHESDPTNKFAFFDGLTFLMNENGTGNSVTSQNAWIESPVIDCSNINTITVKFDQEYRSFNSDNTYVEVSKDGGTTWEQKIDPNAAVPVNKFISSSNKVMRVNFTVDSSATVKVRFRWESLLATGDNPLGGSGYAWEVDNVKVYETYDNDIATSEIYPSDAAGYTYHNIPMDQISPVSATVVATNMGSQDQTNVVLTATEATSGYTGASAPAPIAAGDDSTLLVDVPQGFTPSAIGSYTIDYTVSADATDDVPSNNVIPSFTFRTNDYIYAVDSSTQAMNDNAPATGSGIGSFGPTNLLSPEAMEYTLPYTINQAATLTGIDFKYGDTVKAGVLVLGKLLVLDTTATIPWTELAETQQYVTQAGDEWAYKTLVFDTPITLDPSKSYAISFKAFSSDFSLAYAGACKSGQIIRYIPSQNNYYSYPNEYVAPILRMNFDPTLGTINNEMVQLHVSQFPNPFANETTVSYNLQEANAVSYTVVDVAGNVIVSGNEGNQTAGTHSFKINGSSFANGIYFLKLKAGNSIVTKKMIVNK